MENDPKTVAEVNAFFEEFVKAYPKDDIERYLSFWAKIPNLVVFGTGEKWVGWDEYQLAPAEDRKKYDAVLMDTQWLSINSHGTIAWIACEVTVSITVSGKVMNVPARGTMVVKKKDGQWSIVHAHISIPSE